MNKTKIEWCDSTWSPVTGCLHGCEYCYARRIAERFGAGWETASGELPVLDVPARGSRRGETDSHIEPYPYNFTPTFHRYKLDEPQHWKKPRTIFVCSMADLFGDWVPDNWIEEVFEACEKAPQHRYLFLTKNPARYLELAKAERLPKRDNMWYGSTVTKPSTQFFFAEGYNTFLSIEPLLESFGKYNPQSRVLQNWIILGAMTGQGSEKHQPEKSWVDEIVKAADAENIPVFMKYSLIPIVGEENMRRDFPWNS